MLGQETSLIRGMDELATARVGSSGRWSFVVVLGEHGGGARHPRL